MRTRTIDKKWIILTALLLIMAIWLMAGSTAYADDTEQARFTVDRIDPEEDLQVEYSAPEGVDPEYRWYVGDELRESGAEAVFTVSPEDKGQIIRCEIWNGEEKLSECIIMYSDLPVVYLNTDSGEPIVTKDYVDASVRISGSVAKNNGDGAWYDGVCDVKGHGNSTWKHFDKKSYKIKLDKKTDLFGMGKNKSWLLIANYMDESNMRNKLASYYGKLMGCTAMDSEWVDLVVNGEYLGVYDLFEQIKIGKDRVNIFDWEDAAEDVAEGIVKAEGLTSEDEDALAEMLQTNLSWMTTETVEYNGKTYNVRDYYKKMPSSPNGGFLIEMDRNYDEISEFMTVLETPIMFKSPEYLNSNAEVFGWIQTYIQDLENSFFSTDKTTLRDGNLISYVDLCDHESLVSFWLASEFMRNEIGGSSTYMYKDIDQKLYFGPLWDFDYSADSVVPYSGISARSWVSYARRWFYGVMANPYFAVKARELYVEKEDAIADTIKEGGLLDQWHDYVQESGLHNEAVWHYSRGFEEDFKALKAYIQRRLDWISKEFRTDDSAMVSLSCPIDNNVIMTITGEAVKSKGKKAYELKVEHGSEYKLDIEAQGTAYNLYINGRFVSEGTFTDGKAQAALDDSMFTEAIGKKNVISIWVKDEAGNPVSQQYVTLNFDAQGKAYCNVTYVEEGAASSEIVHEGDKVRLPEPASTDDTLLFAGWNDGTETTAAAKKVTINSDTTFTAVFEECNDGTRVHDFVRDGDGYKCTKCGKTKADTHEYVDVADLLIQQSSRYKNPYTGEHVAPVITCTYGERVLTEGVDYKISYKNDINVGYATYKIEGIKEAGFYGIAELSYRITPASIKGASFQRADDEAIVYDGNAKEPKYTVVFNGKTLEEGKDYTITYTDNVNAGTGYAAITGIGNFKNTKTLKYTIKKAGIKSFAPKLAYTRTTYSGKAKTPKVRFNSKGKNLVKGKDYTVTYKTNKRVGKATATITGAGNYNGTVTKTFKINPKKTDITGLSSRSYKTLTVKLKKVKIQATGYEIRYAARKNFKGAKTVAVTSYKTLVKNIKVSKANKKYYVKVRTYKMVKGVKYVSAWSEVKSVKVK